MKDFAERGQKIKDELLHLVEADTDAFNQMMEAARMKKKTEDEVVADKLYTDQLAATINVNNGRTDFLPPCLAYDKWFTTDKLWGDGSQRHEGVKKSKRDNSF